MQRLAEAKDQPLSEQVDGLLCGENGVLWPVDIADKGLVWVEASAR
jgi:hypothetical protein